MQMGLYFKVDTMQSNYPGKYASFDFKKGVPFGKGESTLLSASFVLRHADRVLFLRGIQCKAIHSGKYASFDFRKRGQILARHRGNFQKQNSTGSSLFFGSKLAVTVQLSTL